MERARTHPFRIILFYLFFLVLGFCVGFYTINLFSNKSNRKVNFYLQKGANTIMTKRMQAIKAAQRQGKDSYEFEVLGFIPYWTKILNKD